MPAMMLCRRGAMNSWRNANMRGDSFWTYGSVLAALPLPCHWRTSCTFALTFAWISAFFSRVCDFAIVWSSILLQVSLFD
jgi:hypothetical protein